CQPCVLPIFKLNVDENPQTAAKYGIQSIPTLMIFKNGQMASRQIGAAPKQKLEQWITTGVWRRPVHIVENFFLTEVPGALSFARDARYAHALGAFPSPLWGG